MFVLQLQGDEDWDADTERLVVWAVDERFRELVDTILTADSAISLEDLQQLARLHMIRRRAKFDAQRGAWSTFVAMTVQRALLDVRRSQNRRVQALRSAPLSLDGLVEDGAHLPDPDGDPVDAVVLERLLATFTPRLRQAVYARMCGVPSGDVARQTGLSDQAISNRLTRARAAIRKAMVG